MGRVASVREPKLMLWGERNEVPSSAGNGQSRTGPWEGTALHKRSRTADVKTKDSYRAILQPMEGISLNPKKGAPRHSAEEWEAAFSARLN